VVHFSLFHRLTKSPWFLGAIAVVLGFGVLGSDYLLHPEAGRFQREVIQDLRSLPLPPDSTEMDFVSWYQPSKGSAMRSFSSQSYVTAICSFYRRIMVSSGWELVTQDCFPTTDTRQPLVEFRKGQITWTIRVRRPLQVTRETHRASTALCHYGQVVHLSNHFNRGPLARV